MNWAASKPWLSAASSIGQSAALACLLEASAPKAGNVTPSVSFSDMDYTDFVISGLYVAPVFDKARQQSVGELVLGAVEATKQRLTVNTNLGTLLLLAPLAKALELTDASAGQRPTQYQLQTCVREVLNRLDARDAELIYSAIRRAKPGGLGRASEHDVNENPPADLRQAMALAAEVDAVARQYVSDFEDVCGPLVKWLRGGLARGLDVLQAIGETQLRWLACHRDGLIVRKVGEEVAEEARVLADIALDEWLETGEQGVRWQALDSFLRADGHRRNPGTTADLIAAALFVLLTTRAC